MTLLRDEPERKLRSMEMSLDDWGFSTAAGEWKRILPKSLDAVLVVGRRFKGPKSIGLCMNLYGEQMERMRMSRLALVQTIATSMGEQFLELLLAAIWRVVKAEGLRLLPWFVTTMCRIVMAVGRDQSIVLLLFLPFGQKVRDEEN